MEIIETNFITSSIQGLIRVSLLLGEGTLQVKTMLPIMLRSDWLNVFLLFCLSLGRAFTVILTVHVHACVYVCVLSSIELPPKPTGLVTLYRPRLSRPTFLPFLTHAEAPQWPLQAPPPSFPAVTGVASSC